ncbi:MAG TPA: hypothetical protein PK098_04300 [Phycisphaerales bacterium]|nr:hypothetical protein [Phycisphaerales bacterium]
MIETESELVQIEPSHVALQRLVFIFWFKRSADRIRAGEPLSKINKPATL